MLLKDVSTPWETHKVIRYSDRERNKAVMPYKKMQCIEGNIYKGEEWTDDYNQVFCDIYAVYPEAPCGIKVFCVRVWDDIEVNEVLSYREISAYRNYEDVMTRLRAIADNGGRVGNAEIAFAGQTDPSLAQKLSVRREEWYAEMDRRDAERRAIREAEGKARADEENAATEALVKEAIDALRNGGRIVNADVTVYRNAHDGSTYKLVNHLARLLDVKIPIRTQGWINERLKEIDIGETTHIRWMCTGKGKPSSAIWDYIDRMQIAAKARQENPS